MRQNGVPSFPDPDSEGRTIITPNSGFDPNSAEFKKAQEACASLQPGGTSSGSHQQSDQMVKYAECMRKNGVPKFPDPQDGRMIITPDSGVDPSSAEFQHAQKACQSLMSGTPGGGPQ